MLTSRLWFLGSISRKHPSKQCLTGARVRPPRLPADRFGRGSRFRRAGWEHRRPRPHGWELTKASCRDGAELPHHGDAVELRPDVGHTTVLEAVEVHALNPDRLAGRGDPHELVLQRTGHDPPGGDGVAAGDDVLQVLLQVGEDRLEERDLLLEAGQRRLVVGRWIVVDQARVAELVDRRLVGRAKRGLEARDDLDVVGHGRNHDSLQGVATDWLLLYSN